MADHHEVVFESEICAYLSAHGWLYSADDTGYDRERALLPEDLFAWLEETQEAAYEKACGRRGQRRRSSMCWPRRSTSLLSTGAGR